MTTPAPIPTKGFRVEGLQPRPHGAPLVMVTDEVTGSTLCIEIDELIHARMRESRAKFEGGERVMEAKDQTIEALILAERALRATKTAQPSKTRDKALAAVRSALARAGVKL